ncbi:MAG: ester cyclase [Parafilimonas sp.]
MKKIIQTWPLFTILFLAASCSHGSKGSVTDENVKSYAHTWDEIVNKGNVKLFDTNFSPNVVYDNVNTHLQGIDDVKKYFEEYITGFSNREFKVLEIYGDGDHVIKRWSFTGTHTGDFAGIKPTGKRITVEGVTIAKMKMGKVVAERDYADDLGLMEKLGVIPAM